MISCLFFVSLLSGCTLNRSEGRNQFESAAPSRISGFDLKSCKTENKLVAWFNEEFPVADYELVLAESDLEIWKTNKAHQVEIRAIQKNAIGSQSCTYEFADETTWNVYRDQFIQELENNLLSSE